MKMIKDFDGLSFNFNLTKNKCFEFSFKYRLYLGFWFTGCITRKQDHPGINLEFSFLGLGFSILYYDTRHWSDMKDRLLEPGEKEDHEHDNYN